jgi:hypothetical protein
VATAAPRGGAGGDPPGEPVFATGYGLILALDANGEVRWLYRSANGTADVHRLRNGNFLIVSGELREIDNYYTSETGRRAQDRCDAN